MDKQRIENEKEYEFLSNLETETSKMRYQTFTALVSISFILPGLAVQTKSDMIDVFGFNYTLSQGVFLMGLLFYSFAVFHYHWYHRYSHRYRKRLKELEHKLDYEIYILRKRPKVGRFKFHFEWALYIIGIIYALLTGIYVGWILLLLFVGIILFLYMFFLLFTFFQQEEPLE